MLLTLLNQPVPFLRPRDYKWRFYVLHAKKEGFRSNIPPTLKVANEKLRDFHAGFDDLEESVIGSEAGQFELTLRIPGFSAFDNEKIFGILGELHAELETFIDFQQPMFHNIYVGIPTPQ